MLMHRNEVSSSCSAPRLDLHLVAVVLARIGVALNDGTDGNLLRTRRIFTVLVDDGSSRHRISDHTSRSGTHARVS